MILERLRAATAERHRELEDSVNIPEVVQDPSRYLEMLKSFFGFHRAMEERQNALDWKGLVGYLPAERPKSPWIAEDLVALGLTEDEIDSLPFPNLSDEAKQLSLAVALGSAYVLEGSTLGGRHISAILRKGTAADLPGRFFRGYGEETADKWKNFCAALERYASEHPDEQQAIISGADDTFHAFQNWLVR